MPITNGGPDSTRLVWSGMVVWPPWPRSGPINSRRAVSSITVPTTSSARTSSWAQRGRSRQARSSTTGVPNRRTTTSRASPAPLARYAGTSPNWSGRRLNGSDAARRRALTATITGSATTTRLAICKASHHSGPRQVVTPTAPVADPTAADPTADTAAVDTQGDLVDAPDADDAADGEGEPITV